MRPQFGVRLALLTIAILAAIFYALFVRPSNVAHSFAEAVNARDYQWAVSLLSGDLSSRGDFFADFAPNQTGSRSATFIYAEVLPREWNDIWTFRRRLIFRVGLQDTSNGRHVEWTEDTQMVAFIDGVDLQRN